MTSGRDINIETYTYRYKRCIKIVSMLLSNVYNLGQFMRQYSLRIGTSRQQE
jgi:hypothetical protein